MSRSHVVALCVVTCLCVVDAGASARSRADWLALAARGFELSAEERAVDVLDEMNPLLSSPDPALRDDVAYAAAERWILREHALGPEELRRVLAQWTRNLDGGLGERGTDTVFARSFSALCLSLVAAADLGTPFLDTGEAQAFFDRMLDYFARERDLRGFDPDRGWMHSVAHTADVLKFLARNPKLRPGVDVRLLDAVRAKIDSADAVFVWGENERIALALHAAIRRSDADPAAFAAWAERWVADHQRLWAKGPQVDPAAYARVENAKQVLRALWVALSLDAAPTPAAGAAMTSLEDALARMR